MDAAREDFNERKRADEALAASERSLKLIIDTIPALAWSARPDGTAEFFNKHYLDYVGLSTEEMCDWGWSAAVHPDDLGALGAAWQRIMASEAPGETEARLRRHDGEYRWFLFRVNPLRDESGAIVKWCGVNTDIEDRKGAERDLRLIVDRLPGMVFTMNAAGAVEVVNQVLLDYLGVSRDEPKDWMAVIHPADRERVLGLWRNAIQSACPYDLDHRLRRVDGTYRWVNARGIPVSSEGAVRWYNLLTDIDERKSAEDTLRLAQARLSRATEMTTLAELSASIAHEVNQPLSGIITNASTCLRMLDADPPNLDGARETARRTIRDGNRASDVIARLRALFRKKEFTLEVLDLNAVTREVMALSRSELQRHHVVLDSQLADDLPNVTGDRTQLQQVILNLLRNASDAMVDVHDRPRQLLIRTEGEDRDRVRVSVRDAGTGVDPQGMDKLFDSFFTTKSDGMGVGLSISRSIIERHHGRLWAEPNDGPGATFSFSIPCSPESVTDTAPVMRHS